MTTLSTGDRANVAVIQCRRCKAFRRAMPVVIPELRGRVDREIRCRVCNALLGIWSSST